MRIFASDRLKWRLLIIAAILWGCLLRFYALGEKVYWEDETFTSLRLSGHSEEELIETAFQGDVVYPADLLQFQIISVNTGLGDTVSSLVNDTHPPGYFVLLRLWVDWFGRSITSLRSLSAVVSLLLLPGIFGLAWMLFEASPQRRAIAELSTALVAVSPYQIALANEARMYSLLPVVTTVAGLCLLWAVRAASSRRAWQRWGGYALASVASLYVHWLAVPILAGYGLYTKLQHRVSHSLHWARAQQQYLLTTALTIGAIAPWVLFVGKQINNVYYQTKWTGDAVGFWGHEESLGQLWLQHGLLLFFDGDIFSQFLWLKWIGGGCAIAFILGVLLYLIRHTTLPVWSFLLISSGIIYTPLAIADILLGGRRSGVFRYLSPSLGAIEISVAFCLVSLSGVALLKMQSQRADQPIAQPITQSITQPIEPIAQPITQAITQPITQAIEPIAQPLLQQAARWTIVLLLIGGALSQTIAKATYSVEQHPIGHLASVVNQTPNALLLSDAPRPSLLLPLAHLLKAETPLKLTVRPDWPTLEDIGDRPVFLYLTSEEFQTSLKEQGKNLRPVAGIEHLLSIER